MTCPLCPKFLAEVRYLQVSCAGAGQTIAELAGPATTWHCAKETSVLAGRPTFSPDPRLVVSALIFSVSSFTIETIQYTIVISGYMYIDQLDTSTLYSAVQYSTVQQRVNNITVHDHVYMKRKAL